jgi:hypothetical protein
MEVRGGDFPIDSEQIAALVLLGGVERSNRIEEFLERAQEAAAGQGEDTDPDAYDNEDLDNLL